MYPRLCDKLSRQSNQRRFFRIEHNFSIAKISASSRDVSSTTLNEPSVRSLKCPRPPRQSSSTSLPTGHAVVDALPGGVDEHRLRRHDVSFPESDFSARATWRKLVVGTASGRENESKIASYHRGKLQKMIILGCVVPSVRPPSVRHRGTNFNQKSQHTSGGSLTKAWILSFPCVRLSVFMTRKIGVYQ